MQKDDIGRIIEQVKNLNMEDVIGSIVTLSKKGSYYYGLCPFHNDKKEGSFVVTPRQNVWKCFSCPDTPGGDAIDFIAKYYKLTPLKAILKIAFDFNIISNDEYEFFTGEKYTKEEIRNVSKVINKKEKSKLQASPYVLNIVYKAFIEECKLSEVDKDYLIKERKLDSEFFTMPVKNNNVMNGVIKNLKENRMAANILSTIPGFFWNKKSKRWEFMYVDGIGIAIRDIDGNIIRLQVRRRNVTEKKQRYIWFSSSFVLRDETNTYEMGTGSGSPIDIIKPLKQKYPIIAVTEGKFKGIALSKLNLLTLSMQGTANWRAIKPEIEKILNTYSVEYPKEKAQIWLCYDSDFQESGKKEVLKSLKSIKRDLESLGLKILFVVWNKKYGKGIDDVINSGNIDKLKKIENLSVLFKKNNIEEKI